MERRLREMVQTRQSVERGCTTYDRNRWMPEHVALTQAIDAGREALALLRVLLTLTELDYGDMSLFYADEPEHPVSRATALLAHCAEDAR